MKITKNKKFLITKAQFSEIIQVLQNQKYKTIGPVVKDDVIQIDEFENMNDLPIGIRDTHEPGSYKLSKQKDKTLFGFNAGPSSVKKYFFPPNLTLVKTKKIDGKIIVVKDNDSVDKIALIGIKPCDLAGLLVQDKIFIEGEFVDSYYKKQRENSFILVSNCTVTADSCFCVSTGTGPSADRGFDLAVTEMYNSKNHRFVIEAGTAAGVNILKAIGDIEIASDDILKKEKALLKSAESKMGRTLNTTGLKDLLLNNLNHHHWSDIHDRCLSCCNCTMVCPTCFCSDIQEKTTLSGDENKRVRQWDSCFSMDYSYIHGGVVRASIKSRYRQWMTHKLASWVDQFEQLGCIGCGRCIVWCPVGIDITAEAKAIQDKITAEQKTVEAEML